MRKIRNIILCTIVFSVMALLTTTTNAANDLTVEDINVAVDNTKAEITWSKANDADGYDVYIDLPAVGYQFVGRVSGNKATVIGFESGKTYGVKVKAYTDSRTTTEYSPEIEFKTGETTKITSELDEVKNITTNSNGKSGTLAWDDVNNADGYEIYASVQNSDYVDIGSTASNKVMLIGMDEEEVYNIKIKPYMEEQNEKVYGTLSDLAVLKYEEDVEQDETPELDKVEDLNVKIVEDEAKLTWDRVDGADGYEVTLDIQGYMPATYETTNTRITLSDFTPEQNYKARVRAYVYHNGEKVYGDYSNTANIRIEEKEEVNLGQVTGVNVTMNGSEGRFTWNSVANADGYELLLNIPGTGPDTPIDATGTSITIRGFTQTNTNYSVKIRAYKIVDGERVYGEYSATKYFKNTETTNSGNTNNNNSGNSNSTNNNNNNTSTNVTPSKVTGLNVSMSGTTATFKWNSVRNADGYQLEVNIPGYGNSYHLVTGTSTTMKGFTNTKYDYTVRVRAYKVVNGTKVYGEYSSKKYFRNRQTTSSGSSNNNNSSNSNNSSSTTTLSRVTGLSANRNGTSATFTWNSVSGADGYQLEVNIPGYGNSYHLVTGTSKTMSGFTNTKYDYKIRVRAYKVVNGTKVYGEYSSTARF